MLQAEHLAGGMGWSLFSKMMDWGGAPCQDEAPLHELQLLNSGTDAGGV